MTEEIGGVGVQPTSGDDLIEIDLSFESMRRFQAEFSTNLSKDGIFIDTGEPLDPGSVVRFRVILPEDFVLLEGTAIVEWLRGLENAADGPPGMALRFATLSPQNQELVEQLVQDHVDAGGTPFNLDVRPEPAELPTDALEPPAGEQVSAAATESFRLTVRRTGPTIKPETEPVSERGEETTTEPPAAPAPDAADEPDSVQGELGFDIVAGPGPTAQPESDFACAPEESQHEPAPESEQEADVGVGNPPELEWTDEDLVPPARPSSTEEPPAAEHATPAVEPEPMATGEPQVASAGTPPSVSLPEDSRQPEPEIEPGAVDVAVREPDAVVEPPSLGTPSDFDSGPEVIDDVPTDDFGGRSFDVSLPQDVEDEPDTTPVLPDDGRLDVTVADDEPSVGHERRLWPWLLGVVAVLVVAGGVLRPYVAGWLENRGADEAPAEQIARDQGGSGQVEDSLSRQVQEAVTETGESESDPEEMSAAEVGGTTGGADSGESATKPLPESDSESVISSDSTEDDPEPAIGAADETAVQKPSPERPSEPARLVQSIDVTGGSDATVLRIEADGSFADGAATVEALLSPPRALIRLRGIESPFRPYVIEADTGEVVQVRIGLHQERRPPELWIVVDLTAASVRVGELEPRGTALELSLGGS